MVVLQINHAVLPTVVFRKSGLAVSDLELFVSSLHAPLTYVVSFGSQPKKRANVSVFGSCLYNYIGAQTVFKVLSTLSVVDEGLLPHQTKGDSLPLLYLSLLYSPFRSHLYTSHSVEEFSSIRSQYCVYHTNIATLHTNSTTTSQRQLRCGPYLPPSPWPRPFHSLLHCNLYRPPQYHLRNFLCCLVKRIQVASAFRVP